MSTVGYGDVYPSPRHGRELGSVIIVIGVGIFGTFTGYLANFFLSPLDGRRPPSSARRPMTPGAGWTTSRTCSRSSRRRRRARADGRGD
jgi:voltage-gated potassium channel